ncbi:MULTISPECIES: transposase [Streptomycetaceae]|uniref:transposase n=1 Tax=Embleya scabrispora TaxID=159449 RepID=UPI000A313B1A|nr:transposase [Streptomyces sp. SID5474]
MSSTDAQWARIESLPPDRTPRRGGRWRDHRRMIDAIAFKYRTLGTPWMDLPEHFGSWKAPTTGCGCGPRTAAGRRSSLFSRRRPTQNGISTGSSRSTPRSSVPTGTPPGPVKRAPDGGPPDHVLGRPAAGRPGGEPQNDTWQSGRPSAGLRP